MGAGVGGGGGLPELLGRVGQPVGLAQALRAASVRQDIEIENGQGGWSIEIGLEIHRLKTKTGRKIPCLVQ